MVVAITVLFSAFFMCTLPEKASARANLTAYLTVPPNSWEPKGYNVTGSAPWLDVQTVGWNAVKLMGNVGIGDGSFRALNATSNPVVNYSDSYFSAADVSMAPLDPTRLSVYGQLVNASNVTAATNTSNLLKNNTTEISPANISNMPLNDPYHSILMGRPVDDLLYENPLAVTISMYARLIGLRVPCGGYANIGIRCLGYGY
jgi:hypothetical protein